MSKMRVTCTIERFQRDDGIYLEASIAPFDLRFGKGPFATDAEADQAQVDFQAALHAQLMRFGGEKAS